MSYGEFGDMYECQYFTHFLHLAVPVLYVCRLQSLSTKGTMHLLPTLQNNEPVQQAIETGCKPVLFYLWWKKMVKCPKRWCWLAKRLRSTLFEGLKPQSYNNNIEGVCNLKICFIYEATQSYLKSYLLQVTSIVLKLQLL